VSHSLRQQRTIGSAVTVTGFGYWTGRDVTVEFRPASIDSGVVFVRTDLPRPVRIPATVAHRVEVPRRTSLSCGGASVDMIEHIMAALAGLQIDNCEVHVDRSEMPGCDGSCLAFVDALKSAGVVEQLAVRPRLYVEDVTRVGDETAWVEARPSRIDGFSLKVRLDYGRGPIGRQSVHFVITPESFCRELAPARTFLTLAEAEWLRKQGLGTRATHKDLLVFGDAGPIDNTLRYEDECVRHKALDLVGDLALSGCDLVGHFVAFCSGHRLNAELVKALLSEGRIRREELRRSA
jgi:UDP-3-O-acyl N-acetylglucosamine deacetylase